jgi:hypothetical protein
VIPRVSRHLCLAWLPSGQVFSDQLVVLPKATHAEVAVLQSRVHELWARFFASTLGDGLRYNPSDCFDTFPFPARGPEQAELARCGRSYVALRARLMLASGEGLTRTYNRFHDTGEPSAGTAELRRAHAEMDRVVLRAYGWDEGTPRPAFREELDGTVRLGWSDRARDELLGRLLELNQRMSQPARSSFDSAPRPITGRTEGAAAAASWPSRAHPRMPGGRGVT